MSTPSTIRQARAFKAAQSVYDNLADDFDDADTLTEDDATELAERALLFDPGVVLDALHELIERDEKPLTLKELLSRTLDPGEESPGRLLVYLFQGSTENQRMATLELADRIRAYLEPTIKDRAAELLRAEARFIESLAEDRN
jgi:hypothetical protein